MITDKRICYNCHSDKTVIKQGKYEHWYKYNEFYLCHKCYMKLILNPKRDKILLKKHNVRRLRYKDKIIYLDKNPRLGICTECGAIKGINCKKTDTHHINYHDDDPLKDTIELCAKCHGHKRNYKNAKLFIPNQILNKYG